MSRRLFILTAAILVVATGIARAAKDDLVIGITQFPSTFHPMIDSMLAKSYILAMTRRSVTVYDANWELVCLLCTELPTLENGLATIEELPDGKQGIALTVQIHPDARWGDGTPVTSDDMVFTWEVGRDPQSGVSNAEAFRRILGVDVVDDKTFVLHVDRVTFNYNDLSGLDILPAHLERPKFADPIEYKNRTAYDTDTTNPGLYFGPYRIDEVVPGSHVVLVPNETWYDDPPHFQRIVARVVENTAALEANLLSGAVDYVAGELGLSLDQALAFEKRYGADFDIQYKAGLVYEHIDLNLDDPILQDPNVRRALLHGIDRQAISEQLFAGKQPVAHSSVSPLDWVYEEDIPIYDYDPDKAAALLEAAGWKPGPDGTRINSNGEPLRLDLMTTAGNRVRELVEQVIQGQLRKIGADIRIRNEPARVFFGETVTRRKFNGMAMFAWISAPENVPLSTLKSDQIPSQENNFAGQNYTGYSNPEMDRLIDDIEVELDRDKRRALWSDLQRLYATDLPVLPLYFRANPYILPKWLKGVIPTGHQYPTTNWIEHWSADN
ncbi:MAG: peptide ABC transporter substrate-binding protein [Alphaproteobacteria bacterium]|nr:peptide ABC transporter substrate-binding protein [Alphaproteobacteria bacterium]